MPPPPAQWDHTATAVAVTAEGLEDLTLRSGGAASQHVVQYEPGRGRAVGSWLSRLLLDRMLRAQLRLQAQGIAQAA